MAPIQARGIQRVGGRGQTLNEVVPGQEPAWRLLVPLMGSANSHPVLPSNGDGKDSQGFAGRTMSGSRTQSLTTVKLKEGSVGRLIVNRKNTSDQPSAAVADDYSQGQRTSK
ncbi:hypothetical protein AAFF_G00316140 [Aldrovandia affinis]|uniref:Uncharacterized protein n=1 Tax=Aldrovandia affinis TaxID=143900 RepID=A0AAD7SN83_9TELE|nr:hypothetical protein AAFF_G00316140 [Aldrovandia affinis]